MSNYHPRDWHWVLPDYAGKAWSSRDQRWVADWPSDRETRIASLSELHDVLRQYGMRGPVVTDSDVTREYERRLLAILEARDLAHAAYIRADDTDELMSLQAMSSRTTEQEARRNELLARRATIETLIAAYNAMASPPPADYTADSYWS